MEAEELIKQILPMVGIHPGTVSNETKIKMAKKVKLYADEQSEKVQCKTCEKEFPIEGTVMHWDTGRRQCVKCYADEQSREKAVNFALFSIYEYSAGIDVRSTDVDNLYDYWKSNQEGE